MTDRGNFLVTGGDEFLAAVELDLRAAQGVAAVEAGEVSQDLTEALPLLIHRAYPACWRALDQATDSLLLPRKALRVP